jgi:alkanesulfonate monooxygenase SsuD/methylene tetrahydromethanopterin reductase-like flavin-dependent oxidoreductase (luciferase family)
MYAQPFGHHLDRFCAVGTPDQVRDKVEEFRSAGVGEILLAPQASADAYPAQIERLAEVLSPGVSAR